MMNTLGVEGSSSTIYDAYPLKRSQSEESQHNQSKDVLVISSGWESGAKVTVNNTKPVCKDTMDPFVVHGLPKRSSSFGRAFPSPTENDDPVIESITHKISNLHTFSIQNCSDVTYRRKSPPKYEEAVAYLNKRKAENYGVTTHCSSNSNESNSSPNNSTLRVCEINPSPSHESNTNYSLKQTNSDLVMAKDNGNETTVSNNFSQFQATFAESTRNCDRKFNQLLRSKRFIPHKGTEFVKSVGQTESVHSKDLTNDYFSHNKRQSFQAKSLKGTIGKSSSLDDGERLHEHQKPMESKKSSSFEFTQPVSYTPNDKNRPISLNRMFFKPIIVPHIQDNVQHNFNLEVPRSEDRRLSAQSLPDLSGPFLDVLCPLQDNQTFFVTSTNPHQEQSCPQHQPQQPLPQHNQEQQQERSHSYKTQSQQLRQQLFARSKPKLQRNSSIDYDNVDPLNHIDGSAEVHERPDIKNQSDMFIFQATNKNKEELNVPHPSPKNSTNLVIRRMNENEGK